MRCLITFFNRRLVERRDLHKSIVGMAVLTTKNPPISGYDLATIVDRSFSRIKCRIGFMESNKQKC